MKINQLNITFPLDQLKTVAVAQYILDKLADREANSMYLLKLIFFADRYHLRKYLRPVTSDKYYAMPRGAVASFLYDVFKGKAIVDGIKKIGNYTVQLDGEPKNQEQLSQSDIEAIDFSLKNFGKFSEWALSEICHAYPEWKKYENDLKGDQKSIKMYFEDFLLNADKENPNFKNYKIQDPYEEISEEERIILTEELFEIYTQIA